MAKSIAKIKAKPTLKSAAKKAAAPKSLKKQPKTLTPEIMDENLIADISPDIDDKIIAEIEKLEAKKVAAPARTSSARTKVAPVKSTELVSSTDPVARYMAEIRKYPLLTREEEHDLAVRYRETGDREAAQKLVTSNLRFVVKVAMEYTKFGARLIDLIQEGNVGLMQAVKEFNPHKGVRLITYAVWWIRGQIQEFLMRHYSMVRIGTTHTQRKLFYELQRSRAELERMGMEAGTMQISGRLGIPQDEVKEMSQRVLQRDVSLDKPRDAEDKTTLLDVTANAETIDTDDELGHREELHILHTQIEKIRPSLTERETFVLENRLLADEPLTLQQIGDRYGMTREAARQLEAKIMKKIKTQMTGAT